MIHLRGTIVIAKPSFANLYCLPAHVAVVALVAIVAISHNNRGEDELNWHLCVTVKFVKKKAIWSKEGIEVKKS